MAIHDRPSVRQGPSNCHAQGRNSHASNNATRCSDADHQENVLQKKSFNIWLFKWQRTQECVCKILFNIFSTICQHFPSTILCLNASHVCCIKLLSYVSWIIYPWKNTHRLIFAKRYRSTTSIAKLYSYFNCLYNKINRLKLLLKSLREIGCQQKFA